jgi:corrinoid protein of di/trimethylamine methyltransferase
MEKSKLALLSLIQQLIIDGDNEKITSAIKDALASDIPPLEILDDGLAKGLKEVGDRFARLEIYLPEMILSAEAMQVAVEILESELKTDIFETTQNGMRGGKIVIGTVQGDIHDLGKNIVATMLNVSGFKVIDVGRDVRPDTFIEEAQRHDADIIAVSALLTTTMPYIKDLIRDLTDLGLRDEFLVMVGGGPVTAEWAVSIGADGYGDTAVEAVSLAREMLSQVSRKEK